MLFRSPILRSHNKDLTIYRVEQRGLLHCELEAPLAGLHLCTVHLDLFEFTRKRQVDHLVRYLQGKIPSHQALILGGDFNDWAGNLGQRLEKELGLKELSARTFPSWFPLLKLDRLYVRGIHVKKFLPLEQYPWNRLSDHLPLFLEFQIRE